jgi:hypothetical protein
MKRKTIYQLRVYENKFRIFVMTVVNTGYPSIFTYGEYFTVPECFEYATIPPTITAWPELVNKYTLIKQADSLEDLRMKVSFYFI